MGQGLLKLHKHSGFIEILEMPTINYAEEWGRKHITLSRVCVLIPTETQSFTQLLFSEKIKCKISAHEKYVLIMFTACKQVHVGEVGRGGSNMLL